MKDPLYFDQHLRITVYEAGADRYVYAAFDSGTTRLGPYPTAVAATEVVTELRARLRAAYEAFITERTAGHGAGEGQA